MDASAQLRRDVRDRQGRGHKRHAVSALNPLIGAEFTSRRQAEAPRGAALQLRIYRPHGNPSVPRPVPRGVDAEDQLLDHPPGCRSGPCGTGRRDSLPVLPGRSETGGSKSSPLFPSIFILLSSPAAKRSESRHGRSWCQSPGPSGRQDGSAGNSSARRDRNRP